jgi:putative peptidoglycan lipid II flippase
MLLLLPFFSEAVMALAWAVFVGGVLQLAFQVPFLSRLGLVPRFSLNFNDEGVWRILKLIGPAILGVSISQISVLINTAFASFLVTSSVSWLYYADRLMQFPTALLGAAVATILLPSLAKYHSTNSSDEYSKLLDWGLRLTIVLALPAMVALMMLSTPLIATLFLYGEFTAVDLVMVRGALIAYSVGLPGIICLRVLAPGFYARQDLKTPFRVAGACVLATMLMNAILIWPLKHAGLALAVSFGASLDAGILFFKLRKQGIYYPQPGWRKFGLKIAIALAVMALVIWQLAGGEDAWISASGLERIVHLFIVIVGAVVAYFGALWLMGLRPKDFSKRMIL